MIRIIARAFHAIRIAIIARSLIVFSRMRRRTMIKEIRKQLDKEENDMEYKAMLEAANKGLPTMKIKGKEYVMVKDRVAAFRREFPGWSIVTGIVETKEDSAIMSAVIRDPDGKIVATGHARESRDDSPVNKSGAWLEVCETSAVGRALACLGIGIDDSEREFRNLTDLCKAHDKDLAWLLATAEAASGHEITPAGYAKVVRLLDD